MSRRLSASAAVVAAALLFVGTGPARADDEQSPLGGYSLVARANPLQITYDSPGLLPVSPIVQVSFPESYATLDTGPSGYGLASLAFPGPLIADLATALKQQDASCQPPFGVPTYPLRSEAFSPQGPFETDGSPIPGSRMRAAADGAVSSAYSAWSHASFPGVFSIGSISGTSSTSGKGADAVTKARSIVNGFSMLAGAITIDSIVTDVTASSNGEKGTTKGTTRVSGATVGGQAVTIDENGVTLAGSPMGDLAGLLSQVSTGLNDALVQSGITIKLVDHHETNDAGLAERVADGLVIQINYNGRTAPLVSTLLAAVPTGSLPADNFTQCAPSSPQGLVNLFKETHIESLALGAASVSSNASAAFVAPLLDDTGIGELPDLSGTGGDTGSVGDLSGVLGSTSGAGALPEGNAVFASNAGVSGRFAAGRAIPFVLILVLLALFPVLGRLTERFADATLAPPVGGTCPLDDEKEGHG